MRDFDCARLKKSAAPDPEQMDCLRAFIREGYRFSQVERKLAGNTILMTCNGTIEDGKLLGAWSRGATSRN